MKHSPGTIESKEGPTSGHQTDWQGLGDLVALVTERLTTPVEGVHHAVSDRWLGFTGRAKIPLRHLARQFTAPVYSMIRFSGVAVGEALDAAASTKLGSTTMPALWESPRGSGVQSFFNGLWGDELERRNSPLSIAMGVRSGDGHLVATDQEGLRRAFPEAKARISVLIHGLGDHERAWRQEEDTGGSLSDVLASHSFTPVLIRYNTGRGVSENGFALSTLLEQIDRNWPIPLDEISLVGHSMGGLVARSALHAARRAGHSWYRLASHIVTLGSPHLGAPQEKGVHLASKSLGLIPESRPIAEFIDQRSDGIKNLRTGEIGDENAGVGDTQLHFMAGAVSSHSFMSQLGDLVVPTNSATGRGSRRRVDSSNIRVMRGRNHRALLHDPEVHTQILSWLGDGSSGGPIDSPDTEPI
ncbi:MAG: hypothetical protein WBM90_12130 [Acidimicrobiia bacterium]